MLRDNTLLFFTSYELAHEPRSKPGSLISVDLVRLYDADQIDDKYEVLEVSVLSLVYHLSR